MESMVHELGIINSLAHVLHAKPNTDAVNSIVRPFYHLIKEKQTHRIVLNAVISGQPDITAF